MAEQSVEEGSEEARQMAQGFVPFPRYFYFFIFYFISFFR